MRKVKEHETTQTKMHIMSSNIATTFFQPTNLRAFVVYVHILVPMAFKCCKSFGAKFYPTDNPVTSLVTA